MKKILVTGNLGYIGSVLCNFLENKNFFVKGLDIGLFKDCNISPCNDPSNQIFKDIRKEKVQLLLMILNFKKVNFQILKRYRLKHFLKKY